MPRAKFPADERKQARYKTDPQFRSKVQENNRDWYKRNRGKVLARLRRREYGIDQETYNTLVEKQGGKCPVCGADLTGHRKSAVDHCHTTGKVRAVLCPQCNAGLGQFKDDPDLLEKAAAYLRQHREKEDGNDRVSA